MRNKRVRRWWTNYSVPGWFDFETIDGVLAKAINGDAGGTFTLEDDLILTHSTFSVTAPSVWANVDDVRCTTWTMNPGSAKNFTVDSGGLLHFLRSSTGVAKLEVLSGATFDIESGGTLTTDSSSAFDLRGTVTASGTTTFGTASYAEATANATGAGDFTFAGTVGLNVSGTGAAVDITPNVTFTSASDIRIRKALTIKNSGSLTFGAAGTFTRSGGRQLRGSSAQYCRRVHQLSATPATANTDYDCYRWNVSIASSGDPITCAIADGTVAGQRIRFTDGGSGYAPATYPKVTYTYTGILDANETCDVGRGLTVKKHWIDFMWTGSGWRIVAGDSTKV